MMIGTIELLHLSKEVFSGPFHPVFVVFLCSLYPDFFFNHNRSYCFFGNLYSIVLIKLFFDEYWLAALIIALFYDIGYDGFFLVAEMIV
jgi:hypothetical protein